MNNKISVVMGVYNCEDTIKESVDSILNQTYRNLELIMCDDGSKDNTLKIINEMKENDSRIIVLKNNENKGLAYSLNKCIDVATGEYIARHDADDICKLNRFEKQIEYMKKRDVDLIGSGIEYFDKKGIWGTSIGKENPTKLDVFRGCPFSHPTIILKRKTILDVGKYTVSNITYRTEDYDLFVKLYNAGYKGANIKEALVKVRRGVDAYKRRKFKYRIDESKCKYKAYKLLKPGSNNFYVCILPIIKGLIPLKVFRLYHKKKFLRK